jgi:transcriptional regulator with XRE-family HTH domain
MMRVASPSRQAVSTVDVLTKAALRAAVRLGITQRELGEIIGVSPAAVSRAAHDGRLPEAAKTLELATLFVRVFRALDAIVGGDETAARAWLRHPNTALGRVPLDAMKTITGLIGTLAYLDSRRALV